MNTILKQTTFSQESHSQELDDAPDKPPTRFATIIVFASFLFIFLVVAISFPIIQKLVDNKEDQVNMGMGNTHRIVYISSEKQILSSTKKKEDGFYQIPIEQAMQMVVARQGNILLPSAVGNK